MPGFADQEYEERLRKVRASMAAAGLDVLYVTSPPNVFYLTGYDAVWYPWRLPLGCAVVREPERLVFFDWSRHEDYAKLHARADELVLFEYGDAPAVVARAFGERGLGGATVGLERFGLNPVGPIVEAVGAALAEAGATVTAGDWIVDDVRLYKSPAELERIRRAGAAADAAMSELRERLRPGMTELQVSALLTSLLADAGSEVAATPALVCSGPTAWVDTHSFPSARELEAGDTVSIDCCGVIDRYHANLCRTFALGEPDPEAAFLLDAAAGSVGELQRLARLGEGPEVAAAAAERWVHDRVPSEKVWWVGGYSLGIALPPSWVGHTYLANDGLSKVTWEPGYVSNYETVLVDPKAKFEACAIDTIVMTEDGLEVLSELPRGLIEVPLP
ncbi:MAG: aminopeptidase P family protein [Actinobacteria bacterium]|nr:aminopeptidase P family protein [Actinomycetota bacterium]